MEANACFASAFNRPLLSISSVTSSSVTFSSAPSSARICSCNGKIFSNCSFKLAFHFSSSAFPMAAYSSWRRSSAFSMTLVRNTRWPALTFLLAILFSESDSKDQVLRNRPLRQETGKNRKQLYLWNKYLAQKTGPQIALLVWADQSYKTITMKIKVTNKFTRGD